jgi:RHS repeat-associated protein
VQELAALGNASAVNANLLTGGIDQTFMRGTGTGSAATLNWVLPEANNSTVITANAAGTVQKSFAYDAYGNTTPGAGTDTNSQQYTGRENDGNGLYYYRNRYYLSGCMRFISEDPIGWASGQTNGYAYVGDDPISNVDPLGLASLCDMRAWHNLKVSEKVAQLRVAGWIVAENIRIQLVTPGVNRYAVADYIAMLPNQPVNNRWYKIGEVKTGNATLSRNQIENYKSGLIQILSYNATPLGLQYEEYINGEFLGVDRYPGCP